MHLGTSAECVSLNKAAMFQERLLDDTRNIQALSLFVNCAQPVKKSMPAGGLVGKHAFRTLCFNCRPRINRQSLSAQAQAFPKIIELHPGGVGSIY
jgi:hypothetical protein